MQGHGYCRTAAGAEGAGPVGLSRGAAARGSAVCCARLPCSSHSPPSFMCQFAHKALGAVARRALASAGQLRLQRVRALLARARRRQLLYCTKGVSAARKAPKVPPLLLRPRSWPAAAARHPRPYTPRAVRAQRASAAARAEPRARPQLSRPAAAAAAAAVRDGADAATGAEAVRPDARAALSRKAGRLLRRRVWRQGLGSH
jgi:hypothetical protein